MSAEFRRDHVTIIGVLNVTPDSFSDGGRFLAAPDRVDVDAVVDAAAGLVRDGAHVLDVGGESTRPGAGPVPAELEIDRTVRAVEALHKRFEVLVSIDTRKAPVAEAALRAGARWVNDVSGLRFDPALAGVVAQAGAGLLLGHARGTPETMQRDPRYGNVLHEVAEELEESVRLAVAAGVPRERLVVDPGIGFGKRPEHNHALLAHAGWLGERLALPVCVGPSRKGFLGALTGDAPASRDLASHAAAAIAIFSGADAVRAHDVAGAARAAAVALALRRARTGEGAP